MKKKQRLAFLSIISLLGLTSCSWLETTTRGTGNGGLLEDNGSRNRRLKKDNPGGVSQEQFDALLTKYKAAMSENRQLKEKYEYNRPGNWKDSASAGQANTVEINANDFQEKVSTKNPVKPSTSNRGIKPVIQADSQMSMNELKSYGKAKNLFDQRNYSESLKLFQRLENSKNDQIRVRAKFYSGLILYNQKEFDISLQVFEEILEKMAYSSYTLEALEYAYRSSVALNMEQKSIQYKSLLQDVFKKSVR